MVDSPNYLPTHSHVFWSATPSLSMWGMLLGWGSKLRLLWDPPSHRSTVEMGPFRPVTLPLRFWTEGLAVMEQSSRETSFWATVDTQSGDAQKCLRGTWAWPIWNQQVQEWASGIWVIIVKWPLCTSALELEEILVKMRKHSDRTWLDNNLWDCTSPWTESLRITTNHGLPWWFSS